MYCGKCGALIPDGSPSCPQCNAVIEETVLSDEIQVTVENQDTAVNDCNENPCDISCNCETEMQTAEAKPKRSRKKTITILISAMLALVLICGGVVCAVIYNSPQAKLSRAIKKTSEEFGEIFTNCKNLKTIEKNIENINKSKKAETQLSMTQNNGYLNFTIDTDIKQDLNEKKLSGDLKIGMQNFDINFKLYGDEEKLSFTLPDLADGCYSVPMKDFGKKLLSSQLGSSIPQQGTKVLKNISLNLFADPSWDDFTKKYSNEYNAFISSLKVTEIQNQIAGASQELAVYSVKFDAKSAIDLCYSFLKYTLSSYLGDAFPDSLNLPNTDDLINQYNIHSPEIYVGVNKDGCVSAIDFREIRQNNTESVYTILLEGSENPWNSISIVQNGQRAEGTASFMTTSNGATFSLLSGGHTYSVVCDDSNGTVSIASDNSYVDIPLSIKYSPNDNGAELSYNIATGSNNLAYTVRVLPIDKVEMLTETSTDLFSMSQDEFINLFTEIGQNIQSRMGINQTYDFDEDEYDEDDFGEDDFGEDDFGEDEIF